MLSLSPHCTHVSLRSILTLLYSHLRLGLQNVGFHLYFPFQMLCVTFLAYIFSIFSVRQTKIVVSLFQSNNYGQTQTLNVNVKHSLPSYRSVTLNPKWCAHSFSKILLLLLLLLFHVRPTSYEKEGTAVSVHMLQGLYCYTVGVHTLRSLRMSGYVPPIQHVP